MRGPSRRFEGNQAISITDDVRPSGQQRHSSPLLGTHQRPNAQSLPPLVDVQRLAEEEDGRGVSCLMEDVEVSKDSRIRRLHAWNGVRIQTCRSENVAQRGPVPKIDDIGWPIHAKPVLPVNFELIEMVTQFEPDLKWLSHKELYESLRYSTMREAPNSEVTEEQLQELLHKGFIELSTKKPVGELFAPSMLFLVAEVSKRRRRVIHDCLAANALLPDPRPFNFVPINLLRQAIGPAKFAFQFDCANWFWQIPIKEDMRDAFAFRMGEKWFRPTVLPMGFKHSVRIAHAIVLWLVKKAAKQNSSFDVYIDNGIFWSTDRSQVATFRRTFLDLCSHFNVQLSECTEVTGQFMHRGIAFDLENNSMKLKETFVDKLKQKIRFTDLEKAYPWYWWRSLIATVVYGATILEHHASEMFHLKAFVRKHVATVPQKLLNLWSSAKTDFICAATKATENQQIAIFQTPCAVCAGLH